LHLPASDQSHTLFHWFIKLRTAFTLCAINAQQTKKIWIPLFGLEANFKGEIISSFWQKRIFWQL
jgi:hypothetical protein